MDWVHEAHTSGKEGGHPRLRDVQLPPNATIVDIGGSTGLIAIVLAKRFPDARVFTFEPLPLYQMYLLWNLAANGVEDRVTLVPYGVGPQATHHLPFQWPLDIPQDCRSFGPRHNMKSEGDATLTLSKFETLPYEDLDKRYGIGKAHLIKVDCEGCEYFAELDEVLATATHKFIELHPPIENFNTRSHAAKRGDDPSLAEQHDLHSRVLHLYKLACIGQDVTETYGCHFAAKWLWPRKEL